MILNVDEALAALGFDVDDPRQSAVALVQKAAERLVKAYLGKAVEQGTFTEYLPAPGEQAAALGLWAGVFTPAAGGPLRLRHTPVRSVSGVATGWPPSVVLDPSAYWLDEAEPGLSRSGLLYRSGAAGWPVAPRSVRVDYVGGWTAAELEDGEAADVKHAVRLAVATKFRELETLWDNASGSPGVGPLASEGIMGWQQTWDMAAVRQAIGLWRALPAGVCDMLQPHKSYAGAV